jgi:inorganic pyrophosphatase
MSFPKPFYRWRPHPWHGLEVGKRAPDVVQAFIELTTFDSVKLEVDKETGYLRVDRPQQTSSQPPTLYGFVPRTYCGDEVRKLSPSANRGDGDPLDICVISERPINRVEVVLNARVVGGLQMVDGGEADDKIIAVLEDDPVWSDARDIDQIPTILVERLRHYFLTYKEIDPSDSKGAVKIEKVFNAAHARAVIEASMRDYQTEFGDG